MSQQITTTKKKRLTKAEKEALAKKKRDREVMFWGIAGCVILIGFAAGWGKFAPLGDESTNSESERSNFSEEVSTVNSMTDMQIDDILDLVATRCQATGENTYNVDLDDLRDILEEVLKEGE